MGSRTVYVPGGYHTPRKEAYTSSNDLMLIEHIGHHSSYSGSEVKGEYATYGNHHIDEQTRADAQIARIIGAIAMICQWRTAGLYFAVGVDHPAIHPPSFSQDQVHGRLCRSVPW